MKKGNLPGDGVRRQQVIKLLIRMKLALALIFGLALQSSAKTTYSQERISLDMKNVTIQKVLKTIENRSDYRFVYGDDVFQSKNTVDVHLENATIDLAMEKLLAVTDLSYKKLSEHLVIIVSKRNAEPSAAIPIRGTVRNSSGEPLEGATISVVGRTQSTVTNSLGEFSLDVPLNTVVSFSFVGYVTQEVTITNEEPLNVVLVPSQAVQQDSVVVVGYGTQKKQSVVSSVSSVKGEELRFPSRNLSTNLAGQVAGLISIQRNGEPGYDNADFWIRGVSTFAGGSRPLVLVDGVPRSLNDIEADEIETFSVLKDAAATAVYGAEGANGVVIITSKRGQARKPIITFRAEQSLAKPDRLPKFVTSDQYLELYNEALNNDGQASIFSDELIEKYRSNADPDLYPSVNWIDVMLKDNTRKERYTINVRGGSDRAKYFVSGAYFNEEGFFKNDPRNRYKNNIGLKRFNLRSNIDLDVTTTTKVSVDLSGQYLITNYPGTGTGTIFRQMMITPPYVFPPVYSDGTISTFPKERDANMRNPYNMLVNSGYAKEWRSGIQSAVKLDQKLNFVTEGLSYRAMVSYDYDGMFTSRRSFDPSRYYATGRDADGKLIFARTFSGSNDLSEPNEGSSAEKRVYFENSLNYNQTFKDHVVGGMLLYMQKETQYHNEALAFRKQGLVGRLTYAYDDKYFLEGNFGYTGSETFSDGYRFGFFPAVGLGYLVSNENFYPESLKKVLSSFKLRYSIGRTGNDNTGGARFLYRPTFGFGAGGFNQGITSGGGSNGYGNGIIEGRFEAPYLSWEIEDKQNFGTDLAFFNGRVQIVADYFNYERSGILLQRRTVPAAVGFRESPWQNFGRVKSWGFDGSLDANHRFDNDLKVTARATYTFTRNKITEYDELPQPFPWMAVTGKRVSENTLYIFDRLYTEDDFTVTQNTNGTKSYQLKAGLPQSTLGGLLGPGDLKYVDVNGDGKIDQFDRKRGEGNPFNPEIIYGFGLNAEFKGFYASVFFQGAGNTSTVLGGNTPEGWFPFAWSPDQSNYREFALDRWSPESPDGHLMPRLHMNNTNAANNTVGSTYWLRDAGFLRLKNAEVGYNFPTSLLDKVRLRTGRLYLMGYNLALWDKIKFWDPETGNGAAGNAYPNSRIFTLGLEVSF